MAKSVTNTKEPKSGVGRVHRVTRKGAAKMIKQVEEKSMKRVARIMQIIKAQEADGNGSDTDSMLSNVFD